MVIINPLLRFGATRQPRSWPFILVQHSDQQHMQDASSVGATEVGGAPHEVGHMLSRPDRKRVLRIALSGRDDIRHVERSLALTVRSFCQHSDQKVLEGDHADAEEHKLPFGHLGNIMVHRWADRGDSTAFLVPPRQSALANLVRV